MTVAAAEQGCHPRFLRGVCRDSCPSDAILVVSCDGGRRRIVALRVSFFDFGFRLSVFDVLMVFWCFGG